MQKFQKFIVNRLLATSIQMTKSHAPLWNDTVVTAAFIIRLLKSELFGKTPEVIIHA